MKAQTHDHRIPEFMHAGAIERANHAVVKAARTGDPDQMLTAAENYRETERLIVDTLDKWYAASRCAHAQRTISEAARAEYIAQSEAAREAKARLDYNASHDYDDSNDSQHPYVRGYFSPQRDQETIREAAIAEYLFSRAQADMLASLDSLSLERSAIEELTRPIKR